MTFYECLLITFVKAENSQEDNFHINPTQFFPYLSTPPFPQPCCTTDLSLLYGTWWECVNPDLTVLSESYFHVIHRIYLLPYMTDEKKMHLNVAFSLQLGWLQNGIANKAKVASDNPT